MRYLLLILSAALLLSACNRKPQTALVSEQPETLGESSLAVTQAKPGRFSLRARVAYDDIEAIAAEELPAAYDVVSSRRLCKRIMGVKACGTANWNLSVRRQGELRINGGNERVMIETPLAIGGVVGVEGKVARALGLAALDVQGVVTARLAIGLTLQNDWCPALTASISYDWIEKPTIVWRKTLDFDLEQIVNDALDKQLVSLEPRLNQAINCTRFREQLAGYWRSYTFALDIPAYGESEDTQQLHLNIVPTGFAFSGIRTETDRLGVSFALDATTVVASDPIEVASITLPPLESVEYQNSRTDFDILLRADYTQLQKTVQPHIVGKIFSSESPAGNVTVEITSVNFSGNPQGVTVALGFNALLPTNRRATIGSLYLNAVPVVNTELEQISLQNVRLSKVLDSTLWNFISSIFEGQIIAAIERNSVFDLAERTRQLEQRLREQLHDPERTGGVNVVTKDLSIRLLEIVPEYRALAARARVSSEIDVDIPVTVIRKPLK